MTTNRSFTAQRGRGSRTALGKLIAVLALVLGAMIALAGFAGGWGMLLFGLLAVTAGVVYFREDRTAPARYKWAAWALIPAFVLIGVTSPDPEPEAETPAAQQSTSASTSVDLPTSSTVSQPDPLAAPTVFERVDEEGATQALNTLAAIPVRSKASTREFDLSSFGEEWSDDVTVDGGHNGCDTRNDILRRDLAAATFEPQSACTVRTGTLEDACTGDSVSFDDVAIDQVVSLTDVWQKGGQDLDADALRNLANDPRNLQAIAKSVKAEKDGGDASTWLPPNEDYRCTYVVRQIEVKAAYQLWTTITERQALEQELQACGGVVPSTSPVSVEPSTPSVPAAEPYAPPPATFVAPPPPIEPEPAPAPAPVPDSGYSGGCGANSYTNVDGNCIPGPVQSPTAPVGASARCGDGTYSYSQHRRGTCSGHGGVDEWL